MGNGQGRGQCGPSEGHMEMKLEGIVKGQGQNIVPMMGDTHH